MSEKRRPYIGGVGMTKFGRFPDRSVRQLASEAIHQAMDDAGVVLKDVQCVFFSNALSGVLTGQECIRGEVVTYDMGFDNVPVINVENACASGGTALHQACRSIAAEEWDCVLVVGAEKMYTDGRGKVLEALRGAMDVETLDVAGLPTDRSPFLDIYAARARAMMQDRGLTDRGFAAVAAKAWANGAANPLAQRVTGMSIDEVLASRMVVEPLTLAMCSLIGDGAAAAIVRPSGRDSNRDVAILASQLRTLSATPEGPSATRAAATAAYEAAGAAPEDIGLAEVHDATAVGEISAWSDLGLCSLGSEQAWAIDGHTLPQGKLPVNTSGGLLARGHPLGASGLAQAFEIVQQLRGEAGPRQIELRSPVALSQIGGGAIDGRTAVSTVHIYERPSSRA